MDDRRALLILGMHRSGTSALTRLLNLRGASLPPDLLPPNAANVTGYWEPTAIVALHDRLLEEAGSRWDDPTGLPPAWFETQPGAGHGSRIAEVVAAAFGESPLIAIKDPRACRVVPAWMSAFAQLGIEPLVVLTIRHPLEVAASLHTRDGMPQAQALLLWLQHQLAAEAGTRFCKRVIVTYDQVLEDWRAVLARIDQRFGLDMGRAATGTDREITSFLDPNLRHERVEDRDLEGGAGWLSCVYRWYERASVSDVEPDASELDRVFDEVRRAATAYGPLLRWHRSLETEQARLGRETEQRRLETEEIRQQELELLRQRAGESDRRFRDLESRLNAQENQQQVALEEARMLQEDLRRQIRMMESSWFWQARTRLNSLLGR